MTGFLALRIFSPVQHLLLHGKQAVGDRAEWAVNKPNARPQCIELARLFGQHQKKLVKSFEYIFIEIFK